MSDVSEEFEGCLGVGKKAIVAVEPESSDTSRYMVELSGWQRDQYLLFECGVRSRLGDGGVQAKLGRLPVHARNEVIIRFVSDGAAFGFREIVTETIYIMNAPHFVTRWPRAFDRLGLRKKKRYEVNIGATAALANGNQISCKFHDVSFAGCGLLVEAELHIGDLIKICGEFPDGTAISDAIAEVRFTERVSGDLFRIGVEFRNLDAGNRASLENFVRILEADDAPDDDQKSLWLILTPSKSLQDFHGAANEMGKGVVFADDVADFLYRARALKPEVVIIDCNHDGWSGMDVCSYVRNCRQLSDARLVLVGIETKHVEVTKRLLGADLCVPIDEMKWDTLFSRIWSEIGHGEQQILMAGAKAT